ncbi:hypothetical protein GCM10010254_67440 [Streptomyces chromofuscus]|nr:hypothetical protein GCM10010254_67440 [Streptomyces chromofuscus]
MSSGGHDDQRAAAALEAVRPWLPTLSGLSLTELAALDDAALEPSAERLRRGVDRPISTIGGSDGS